MPNNYGYIEPQHRCRPLRGLRIINGLQMIIGIRSRNNDYNDYGLLLAARLFRCVYGDMCIINIVIIYIYIMYKYVNTPVQIHPC